jgi:predicted Zn-dependent peptidase
MNMLDEGAGEYDAIALGNRQEQLGAVISASAGLDSAEVSLSSLKENLAPSLALWSDMIRRPRFEAAEVERVRNNWLAGIRQEKTQPSMMGMRVIGPVVFGAGHPYAIPFTGTGYEADIATLDRNDLLAWHQEQIRPDTATILIVGDTTLAEIVPMLESTLGDWAAPSRPHPSSEIPSVALPAQSRVFIVDQPGAVQSNIVAAQLLPSSMDKATVDLEFANAILGGDFTSRLNMNLREDKHWSYGARSSMGNAIGQRLWTASAPVQSDKTIESIKEMQKEIADYASGKRAITDEEVARLQAINIRSLPGSYETARNVLSTLGTINRYGRPDDFVVWRKGQIEKMTPAGVQQVATSALHPESMTWIVVGDRAKIEAGIRALNIGEVTVVDADGKVVK